MFSRKYHPPYSFYGQVVCSSGASYHPSLSKTLDEHTSMFLALYEYTLNISQCLARKVPELCQPYTPGKSDQDLHARLARVEHVLAAALPEYWSSSQSGSHHNGTDHRGSPSPGVDDDKASQADDEDVSGGIYESGRWYGTAASGSVAASAMLEKVG